jgi:hypothetical protein
MKRITRIALAGLMAASIMGSATQAFASEHSGGGGGVTFEGSCSGASTWKLKLSPENGRIEADFEVDQNVVGDTWKVRMSDNGTVFFRGTAVTKAPSGSFEVRKLTADQAGADSVIAMAKNVSTGETCQGAGSI